MTLVPLKFQISCGVDGAAFFVAGYGSGDDYFWSLKICNAATARVFVVMPLPSATVSSCNCRKNGARGDAANDAAKN